MFLSDPTIAASIQKIGDRLKSERVIGQFTEQHRTTLTVCSNPQASMR